ncbi:MAG: DUF799 domain-containing protein, partial [Actinobacteria bacterium]|nr:DUF799 domain-containing protein [Actinomycetota bacterium]
MAGIGAYIALDRCTVGVRRADAVETLGEKTGLAVPQARAPTALEGGAAYLSTVTEPLAERGYYVFPVAVVDRMLRDNGLPGPGEMHQVPLTRLGEVFGADAVMYITLHDWGTAYRVIDSSTEVTAEASLVDVASGTEIWRAKHTAVYSS